MLWGGVTLPHCPHSILTLSDYVTELGHPYVWVQKLGGLHFPKDQPQVCHTPSPLHQNFELGFGEALGTVVMFCPVPPYPRTPGSTSCSQTMVHPWLGQAHLG